MSAGPKTAEELKALGNEAFAAKDFTKAIKYYNEAIMLDKSKDSPELLIDWHVANRMVPRAHLAISLMHLARSRQSCVLFQSEVSCSLVRD